MMNKTDEDRDWREIVDRAPPTISGGKVRKHPPSEHAHHEPQASPSELPKPMAPEVDAAVSEIESRYPDGAPSTLPERPWGSAAAAAVVWVFAAIVALVVAVAVIGKPAGLQILIALGAALVVGGLFWRGVRTVRLESGVSSERALRRSVRRAARRRPEE